MPITNFPAYTGTALSRNLTQAQFDEAEEYFQAYQAAWAAQMNGTTIPQLNTLETTCINSASTATTKAGEALSSANSAGDSATLAGKWASEAVDVVVQSGKYSAFHWATKAYEYVATLAAGAINDSITALNATWSSTKLSTLTKDQINAATTKATPVDADSIAIVDSADSNNLKRVPWSNAIANLGAIFAPLVSPAFTGTPTAPTATSGTNTTQIATTGHVHSAIKNDLNITGSAPMYACRAWVNFNGTGTVAIRGSGNVSSIGDNGVGNYTINFSTGMPDANYSITGIVKSTSIGSPEGIDESSRSSSSFTFIALNGGTATDTVYNDFTVIR